MPPLPKALLAPRRHREAALIRHRSRATRKHNAAEDQPAPSRGVAAGFLSALPTIAVLLVIAAGFVLVLLDHWRRGSAVLAAAAALAAVLRMVLPTRLVGVLAVRSRWFDVIFLLVVTVLMVTMALAVQVPQ